MGGKIFAHPFRIGSNGSVSTVEEASEQGASQLIAAVILTRRGELPMYPTFGIEDPIFSTLEPAEVAAVISAYGPNVRLLSIDSQFTSASTQQVAITFSQDTDKVT